jgi:AraC-like DNA-binding protein
MGTERSRMLEDTGIAFTALLRPDANELLPAIDAAILKSIDASRPQRLLQRIRRAGHMESHALFACSLDQAIEPSSVVRLAAQLHLTVRTLQRHCSRLEIPSPKWLLALARIFTVERLAEWSQQPSGAVAVALGSSDRSNYRRLVRRVLGAPPGQIRLRGGVTHIENIIVQEVASTRGAPVKPLSWAGALTRAGRAGEAVAAPS